MDITAVLMTHAEGALINASFESFEAGIVQAESCGIKVQRIVTADNPSQETLDALNMLDLSKYDRLDLNYGDLGKVRNHAATIAEGHFFAILDGDDLWSENWLTSALKLSQNSKEELVVHPEINWLFEGINNIFYHINEDSELFDRDLLRSTNPWDSLCFCRTTLVKEFPYLKREIKNGFAYEDWNWNRRVLEHGVKHVVASNTIIFKRRRAASQGAKAAQRGVIAKPTLSSYYDAYEL